MMLATFTAANPTNMDRRQNAAPTEMKKSGTKAAKKTLAEFQGSKQISSFRLENSTVLGSGFCGAGNQNMGSAVTASIDQSWTDCLAWAG
jgi:hypothetical protein